MKRTLLCTILVLFVSISIASPVYPGIWHTVRLADGREIKVYAFGDERQHYWQGEDGLRYVKNPTTNLFEVLAETPQTSVAQGKRYTGNILQKNAQQISGATQAQTSSYVGQKKGLIILVEFPDQTFSMSDPKTFYDKVANLKGFNEQYFNGSVHDYFYAQSDGKFDLSFDVVGPVKVSQPYSYYGNDNEAKVPEMVREACIAINTQVDFSNYDWNKDGEVEEVFALYSGYGQADHPDDDKYIWPHMFWLQTSSTDVPLVLDRTKIDTYACANEMTYNNYVNGIGTICHEFSHCLGLPDMYDTNNGGNYGMGSWDLMDSGCYNGFTYTPSGYTGYERMICGWASPVSLNSDTIISGMRPLSDKGTSYIIYNPNNKTEYYILDNRQLQGFDKDLPGHGLLITHIDYDQTIWDWNSVNSTGLNTDGQFVNNHQRATIFHADNNESFYSEQGDTYPYNGNDSLTRRSIPACELYNRLTDNQFFMPYGFVNIAEHNDGTISFAIKTDTVAVNSNINLADNKVFSESFDLCAGTGGNDGRFNYSVAIAELLPDNVGWAADYGYGGDKCARFGSTDYTNMGDATTPSFTLTGDTCTLTFRAAGWNTLQEGTELQLALNSTGVGSAKFVDSGNSEVTLGMTKGVWKDFSLELVGEGQTKLTFKPSKRFFLDDVMILKQAKASTSEIKRLNLHQPSTHAIFAIDGRYVGNDLQSLPYGIYIVDGKKVVK